MKKNKYNPDYKNFGKPGTSVVWTRTTDVGPWVANDNNAMKSTGEKQSVLSWEKYIKTAMYDRSLQTGD